MRQLVALIVGATLVAAPVLPAFAGPPTPLLESADAQQQLDAAVASYADADFELAARRFADAFAIEPAPFLLYSWAQAERHAGRCPRALELYARFLDTDPPPAEARRAREKILVCGGVPPAEPPPPEAVPVPAEPPRNAAPVARPAPPPPRPPRWPIAVGVSGMVIGAAVATAGGVLVDAARRRRARAVSAADQQAFVDDLAGASRQQRTGWALVGVGSAVLLTGIIVTAVIAARRSSRPPSSSGQARQQ